MKTYTEIHHFIWYPMNEKFSTDQCYNFYIFLFFIFKRSKAKNLTNFKGNHDMVKWWWLKNFTPHLLISVLI